MLKAVLERPFLSAEEHDHLPLWASSGASMDCFAYSFFERPLSISREATTTSVFQCRLQTCTGNQAKVAPGQPWGEHGAGGVSNRRLRDGDILGAVDLVNALEDRGQVARRLPPFGIGWALGVVPLDLLLLRQPQPAEVLAFVKGVDHLVLAFAASPPIHQCGDAIRQALCRLRGRLRSWGCGSARSATRHRRHVTG